MGDVPNWVWWTALLSPAPFTLMIAVFYLRRNDGPISIGRSMLISAPAALPLAAFSWIAVDASKYSDFFDLAFWLFIVPFGWASAFGPAIVGLAERAYLKVTKDSSTETE